MNRHAALCALLTLGAGGCCFGGSGSFDVSGPTTHLGPGFAPDPMILSGSAGGLSQASALDPSCRGYVGIIPSHTLQISAPMPMLRVMALSGDDTTLVVRRPEGVYVCNDDSDGLNPSVDLANVQPGAYGVYVGTYASGSSASGSSASGSSASYQLGLTTNPSITPTTMLAPAGGAVGVSAGGAPGTVLRTGNATVALASGNLPGVTPGSTCSYTQTAVDPAQYGFDCRWQVVCGGAIVYGDGDGGFNPCSDPSWPPGTLVADTGTSSSDGDPSFVLNAGGMTVRDDAQGARGAFQITATSRTMPFPPG